MTESQLDRRNKMQRLILVLVMIFIGLWARAFTFQNQHPDTDELFELRNMQGLKAESVINNKTFYGDLTSFPGEFLIHAPMMAAIGMFTHPRQLAYETGKIDVSKKEFWVLAIPKIVLSLLSLWVFWLLCREFLITTFGAFVAFSMILFNQYLIYAAFSLRPYGVLPELFIFNLYLASRENKSFWFSIFHGYVVFLTCINHAYGPMMALLPVLYFRKQRGHEFYFLCGLSLAAWAYYASYSNFGIHPNSVQSVLSPFLYIKQENLFEFILQSLFCTSVITTATAPFVLMRAFRDGDSKWWFLITMVLIPLAAIVLIDIKTHYIIHPRQYVWIIPALGLWCGMLTEKGLK